MGYFDEELTSDNALWALTINGMDFWISIDRLGYGECLNHSEVMSLAIAEGLITEILASNSIGVRNTKAHSRFSHLEREFTFEVKVPIETTNLIYETWDRITREAGPIHRMRNDTVIDTALAKAIKDQGEHYTIPYHSIQSRNSGIGMLHTFSGRSESYQFSQSKQSKHTVLIYMQRIIKAFRNLTFLEIQAILAMIFIMVLIIIGVMGLIKTDPRLGSALPPSELAVPSR